jgi:hypothetical protein
MVGRALPDHLHGDLPPHLRLERPVDGPERALADPFEQPVAPEALAADLEGGILAKDLFLELLELGRGVDPEVVEQHVPGPTVRGEGVALTPGPVQGDNQVAPQSLPVRMAGDEGLELADELPVAAQLELGRDPFLQGCEPDLLEPGDLRLEGGLLGQVVECRPPPQAQRLAQPPHRAGQVGRSGAAGGVDQLLELQHVEIGGVRPERVAGGPVLDAHRPDLLAQEPDVGLERVPGGLGRVAAPDGVDQALGGHDAVGLEQEVREHGPLLGTPERHRPPVLPGLQRTEHQEPHEPKVPPAPVLWKSEFPCFQRSSSGSPAIFQRPARALLQ